MSEVKPIHRFSVILQYFIDVGVLFVFCSLQLPCGHRCKEICHSGACPLNCSQKVKLRCLCKRLKKVNF